MTRVAFGYLDLDPDLHPNFRLGHSPPLPPPHSWIRFKFVAKFHTTEITSSRTPPLPQVVIQRIWFWRGSHPNSGDNLFTPPPGGSRILDVSSTHLSVNA